MWEPQPENRPQQMAYESSADVLGYGGAAGGGKSDLLLGLALTRHRRSLILRREGKQLRAVIDRSREIADGRGRFNENTGVWRDLPDGRQLELGGVKDAADVHNHKGRPKDFLGIDEADQFTETMVRFLMGWVRTTVEGQRCRTVLTFNPPTSVEGRWLLTYFAPWLDKKHPRPAKPGELRWYAMLPEGKEVERPDGRPFENRGETITPRSRSFIPARVTDNAALMRTGYLATLQALPEPLRSQLIRGDFAAGIADDPWQVIPTAWVEAAMARWTPAPPAGVQLSAVGVDVARGGADQTVLAKRYGPWFARPLKYPGRTTPDGPAVAALVAQAITERPTALVCIDVIGIGAAAYDACRQIKGCRTLAVNFAESAGGSMDRAGVLTFTNVRAMAYWSMRDLLDPAARTGIMLPPDPELLGDLTAPRWRMTPNGVRVEPKEDVIARLGRSPDCGDAVVQAILMPTALPGGGGGPAVLRA